MLPVADAFAVAVWNALGWAGDHWFQVATVLFMFRVWVGLSAISGLVEQMCASLVNDNVSNLLRQLDERHSQRR